MPALTSRTLASLSSSRLLLLAAIEDQQESTVASLQRWLDETAGVVASEPVVRVVLQRMVESGHVIRERTGKIGSPTTYSPTTAGRDEVDWWRAAIEA